MKSKKIPYSKGLPIIGHLITYSRNRLNFLLSQKEKHGDIFKVKIGPKKIIVINHPDHIQHIMHTKMHNYIKKTNLDQLMGQSIATTNGKEWKKQRKLIQPLMSTKYLENAIPHIYQIAQDSFCTFSQSQNDRINFRDTFSEITFSIIMKTIIGLDPNNQVELFDKNLAIVTNYLTGHNYNIFDLPECLNKKKRKFKKALKEIDEFIYDGINKEKLKIDSQSMISIMLKHAQAENLSDKFVRDNLITMIFAGYETSAVSLSWLTYCLTQSPEWLKKCSEEALNFKIENCTLQDLVALPHIEAVILETIRLYPPGWGFLRFAKEDDDIDGYPIKKDDIILSSQFLAHRDTTRWDEANIFKPERFFQKPANQFSRYQYFPFGAGPRICTGMQFALMEMKLILVTLLKDYTIELVGDKPILDARITLISKNGFQIRIHKKN